MAAEIKQAFDIETELIKGANGIFDVKVDGKMVFSKHELERFPEDGELVKLIRETT